MKYYLFLMVILISCGPSKKIANDFTPQFTAGPPTLVYKTKGEYRNLVPVLLSDNKAEIISYPAPSDLKVGNEFSLPTLLKDDYLLDNRGIGKNVAFLKLTYEEYSKLSSSPTLSDLYQLVIDKDPLTELCDCGNRTKYLDVVVQLNQAIESQTLKKHCKTLK